MEAVAEKRDALKVRVVSQGIDVTVK